MRVIDSVARIMPDIAKEARPHVSAALDWVGMGEIEVPVMVADEQGIPVRSVARVTAYVNLHRPEVRGIHMSRLYLHIDRGLSSDTLSPRSLRQVLKDFLDSHQELSDRALLKISFDHMVRRPALASDNSGWKSYPVQITGLIERGQFSIELAFEVTYSSTCPCSAALARQLIQERFQDDFPAAEPLDHAKILAWLGTEQGICATPHSQRSVAEVRVRLLPGFANFPILELVDEVEKALKTPVQAAVKREDEQAFARLNGTNLMFCEDAARRIQGTLNDDPRVTDFWVRATHYESLHPHNAVAVVTKGVADGYSSAMDSVQPLSGNHG